MIGGTRLSDPCAALRTASSAACQRRWHRAPLAPLHASHLLRLELRVDPEHLDGRRVVGRRIR